MGWVPYINASSNLIYYVNPVTQEPAWTLPSGTDAEWREPIVGDIVILSTHTAASQVLGDKELRDKVLGDVSEHNRGTVVNVSKTGILNVEVKFNGKTDWYNKYSLLVVSKVVDRESAADVALWEFTESEKRVIEEQQQLKAVLDAATAAKGAANAALVAAGKPPTTSAILEKTKCLQLGGRSRRRRFKSRRTKKTRRTGQKKQI